MRKREHTRELIAPSGVCPTYQVPPLEREGRGAALVLGSDRDWPCVVSGASGDTYSGAGKRGRTAGPGAPTRWCVRSETSGVQGGGAI